MTKAQIEEFKCEMKYYLWLKDSIARLESKAEEMLYDLENVKGIRYDKQVMNANEQAISESKLIALDHYNKVLDTIRGYQDRLDYLNKVLDLMTVYERSMFLMKYEENMSFQEIANHFYISKAGLFYRMQKVLERIEI